MFSLPRLLNLWFRHPWSARAIFALLGIVLALALAHFAGAPLDRLQEQSRDVAWRLAASSQPERRVVLVDIDDDSLQAVGPWPWPRTTLAELTRELDAQGASLKLFDIVLPDAREGDSQLRAALSAGDARAAPSVLAQVFALRHESQLRSGALAGAMPGIGCQSPAVPAQGFLANAQGLHPRAGHITPTMDGDGAVRRMAALVCMDERVYPALALAGVASLGDTAQPLLDIRKGQGWSQPAWSLELASLPGHPVGVDAQGQIRIPYASSRAALTRVSAVDVLQRRVPPELLQGAWVVVGASAFGLADVVSTALGEAVSGAEVHMQLLLGMLDGRVPYAPQGAAWLQAGYAAVLVLALLWLSGGAPLPRAVQAKASASSAASSRRLHLLLPLVSLAAAASAWALQGWALVAQGVEVGWIVPALVIVCCATVLALGEQMRLVIERRRIYQNLASYVSSPVAAKIALNEPSGDIQATRRDVTILTADLKNFARYCEACSPEDTAGVLHRFFTTAGAIIEAHGGVVEEMVGDSIVAVFNGEQDCADHPAAALKAARQLWQRCSGELPNTTALGLESLSIGVGLESGTAMVGSFGPAGRRVHTVLGQTVTIALRLRGMTTDLAYPLLLGPGLAQCLGAQEPAQHMEIKTLGSFLLPGLMRPSTVYTLRHLLQPGDAAEQRTLLYLHHQQQHSAA